MSSGSSGGDSTTGIPPGATSSLSASLLEDYRDEGEHGESRMAHRGVALTGSAFNLSAATLGAGALSVPFAMASSGIILGVCFLVLAALATVYSIELLTAVMAQLQLHSYEALCEELLGRGARIAVEAAILAFCLGTCVAYIIALGDILSVVATDMDGLPAWTPSTPAQWMVAVWAAALLPLSSFRSLAPLQHASFLGTASLFVLVAGVCVHAASRSNSAGPAWTLVMGPRPGLGPLARAVSITLFAFTCHVNVPEIYVEMRGASVRRMRRVAVAAVALAASLYVVVGVAAVADFGRQTEADVLNNFRGDGGLGAMAVPFACMACTIVMAYPLNIFPARATVLVAVAGNPAAPHGVVAHCTATLALSSLSLLVAIYVPGINVVFEVRQARCWGGGATAGRPGGPGLTTPLGPRSCCAQLLGATASAFVCFCLPATLALVADVPQVKSLSGRLAARALALGGGLFGAVATVVSLMDLL